ncbi:MAG TPA: ABC transporter permease [Hyphomicrobiales bacterium]|nr:ABC transporter permease [Hyphomicrobiales bacterium]
MARYLAGRIGQAALTVLFLLTFVFAAIRLTGDPTNLLLPAEATQQDRDLLRQSLHLDQPLLRQYASFLEDLARGDLGRSYKYEVPVTELIRERLPATLKLAFMAGGLTLLLGVPFGIVAAQHRRHLADHLTLLVALIGQSVPIFVIALVAVLIFSVNLHLLPVAGVDSPLGYVLPVVTLAWFGVAAIIRVTRVSMIGVLESEYIVTARAKGLPQRDIIYVHALRNALIPIVTMFSLVFATLLTGTVVTETMFSIPGVGRLAVESILNRDFPVVQAVVILVTVIYVAINLAVDILYGFIDPRTRSGGR